MSDNWAQHREAMQASDHMDALRGSVEAAVAIVDGLYAGADKINQGVGYYTPETIARLHIEAQENAKASFQKLREDLAAAKENVAKKAQTTLSGAYQTEQEHGAQIQAQRTWSRLQMQLQAGAHYTDLIKAASNDAAALRALREELPAYLSAQRPMDRSGGSIGAEGEHAVSLIDMALYPLMKPSQQRAADTLKELAQGQVWLEQSLNFLERDLVPTIYRTGVVVKWDGSVYDIPSVAKRR